MTQRWQVRVEQQKQLARQKEHGHLIDVRDSLKIWRCAIKAKVKYQKEREVNINEERENGEKKWIRFLSTFFTYF